jgi:hypothetical protein
LDFFLDVDGEVLAMSVEGIDFLEVLIVEALDREVLSGHDSLH